ncbi:hypothetical protein TIFTF001_038832 [Ficus carica]|uniref:Uncharacterized protein n=1 Tax=Ficus carica TaxID=3494 RepID=A0AA88E7Z6_FICCA|nr:hypothetical protein TIFTF001_038832 [Ficus carica]
MSLRVKDGAFMVVLFELLTSSSHVDDFSRDDDLHEQVCEVTIAKIARPTLAFTNKTQVRRLVTGLRAGSGAGTCAGLQRDGVPFPATG